MANLNTILQAHQARANFYQILDEVSDQFRQFTITLHGKTKAVIMSAEEHEGWLETLDIMSHPQLVKDIKSAQKSNKTHSWEEVKKQLKW